MVAASAPEHREMGRNPNSGLVAAMEVAAAGRAAAKGRTAAAGGVVARGKTVAVEWREGGEERNLARYHVGICETLTKP
jgi:hypothetical protein